MVSIMTCPGPATLCVTVKLQDPQQGTHIKIVVSWLYTNDSEECAVISTFYARMRRVDTVLCYVWLGG
jgi:hypothetical protein